jgi:DNA replicative helicase MCM subunit Mcm2 (Cdc46/Mcm family)
MRYVPAFESAFKEYIRDNSLPEKHPGPKVCDLRALPSTWHQHTALDFFVSCVSQLVYHLGFSGSFGANRVNARTLTAHLLGKMVCVEGIVTKCTRSFAC